MLVYEYMARGSLENHLFKSKSTLLDKQVGDSDLIEAQNTFETVIKKIKVFSG